MKTLFATVVLVLVASVASAQTPIIITPQSTLNATPNADYNTLDLAGNPVTQGVKVQYCLTAAPTNCLPMVTVTPKPVLVNGEVVITNVINSIQPNTSYTARMFAFGPGGDSLPTNLTLPFGNAVVTAPLALTNARIVK